MVGQGSDLHGIESTGAGSNRLKEGGQDLVLNWNILNDVVSLENIEEDRAGKDEEDCCNEHNFAMEGEPLLHSPKFGKDLILDDKSNSSDHK